MNTPARICLAVAMAHTALAAHASAQWQAGAKVGFGKSGYSGSQEFTWNNGPSSAAFLSLAITRAFSMQFEASAVRLIGTSNAAGSMLTLTADYLTFPFLAQFRLPTPLTSVPLISVGPVLTFSAGPIFAIRLSCGLSVIAGNIETSEQCDDAGRPTSSPVTAGVGAGTGIEQSLGIATLLVEGRVSTGLTVEAVPVDSRRPRRFGWTFMAGLSLPLRHANAPPEVPTQRPAVATAPSSSPASVVATREPSPPLPSLPIADVAMVPAPTPPSRDVLDEIPSSRRVTVNATDADVRSLLLAIARQGGVSILVDPEVSGRVWVSLNDVPVADALRAVIEAAHLAVRSSDSNVAQPAVVFYQLPVNIDNASATTIAKRFGVSSELANWVVLNQPKATAP